MVSSCFCKRNAREAEKNHKQKTAELKPLPLSNGIEDRKMTGNEDSI